MLFVTLGAVILVGLAVYMGYAIGYSKARVDLDDEINEILIDGLREQTKQYGKNISTKKRPLKK